jgi:cation transport ATPase
MSISIKNEKPVSQVVPPHELAASVELGSEHPLGQAIVRAADAGELVIIADA